VAGMQNLAVAAVLAEPARGELGVRPDTRTGRPLLRDCLDWTERREHLGGATAAALLDRSLEAGWLRRGDDRSIRIHPAARGPLATLGVDIDAVADSPTSGGH
jgi:hypothetical protein